MKTEQFMVTEAGIFSINQDKFLEKTPISDISLYTDDTYIGLIQLIHGGKFFFNDLNFSYEFKKNPVGELRLVLYLYLYKREEV